ncbi:MAG TPA: cysteine desulfurase-like protein [Candidatus Binatia bacterium]|nr:cysteine desulfurase-like protein [Candidatus Binatia bacterium]
MSGTAHADYPIDRVRDQFPALQRTHRGRPAAYLDGPGGSQVCRGAIAAITTYMERGGANLHGQFPTSHETEAVFAEARAAVADLLGGRPEEVAFGPNMTTLTLSISRALSRDWKPGDEIVVTEMDHNANVDPWLAAAADRDVKVRWIPVDRATLTLDLSALDSLISERTRVVALGAASNAIGAVNDIAAVSAVARAKGALVYVDAVHGVPHFFVDREALGIDIVTCSAYKFFGPHVGVTCIRRELFERMKPYKVAPSPTAIPDCLETGTQNHEALGGVVAAVDFIAGLGAGDTRRARIESGYRAIEAWERGLAEKVRQRLRDLPTITLFEPGTARKTPTFALDVHGEPPLEVSRWMADEHAIFVADGNFYAVRLGDVTGVNPKGGWLRAGLAPYTSEEEATRFVDSLEEYLLSAGSGRR